MGRLHFFDQTIIDEAVAAQLQHASCTMDDPLTAAQESAETAAAGARASGAVTELQAEEIRRESEREADWLLVGAVVTMALVSLVSYVWPMLWAAP